MPPNAGRCRRYEFDPWIGKIPLKEEMATHSMGCSPQGQKESDMTEHTHLPQSYGVCLIYMYLRCELVKWILYCNIDLWLGFQVGITPCVTDQETVGPSIWSPLVIHSLISFQAQHQYCSRLGSIFQGKMFQDSSILT